MAQPLLSKNAIKAIMANPTARRLVVQGAKKAAKGAVSTYQSVQGRAAETKQAQAPKPAAPAAPPPVANRIKSAASGSVVESVARPWAEKLAETTAGRSVLEALYSVTSEVLHTAQPQKPASAFPSIARTEEPSEAKVKFTPLTPPAPQPAAREQSIKWPPGAADRAST